MNTHFIQIQGKTPIELPLDDTKDYSMAFKLLGVRSVVRTPLEENGNYAYTYKLENLGDVTVIAEDKVIFGKNKSNSKRLRNRAWIYSQDNGLDDEKFYDEIIGKIILNFDEVVEFLNKSQ
jgi:hypothetical protein